MSTVDMTNRKLFNEFYDKKDINNKEVTLKGWVRSNRNNGSIGFIEFNDGTYFKNIQIVYESSNNFYDEFAKIKYGSAISITGKVVLTPSNKQPFEIHGESFKLEGDCQEDYPLQKNDDISEISEMTLSTSKETS